MRVVAYVRVSTERQVREGESLDAQREQLKLYAQCRGLEIVALEVDAGLSASSLERPGLTRALERLNRFEAEGLLVCKLDRLTRSVKDLCTLVDTYFKDGQHRLMSVNEAVDTASASGRLVLNILVTVSQWEREAAAERTSIVMQHLKNNGEYTGGWPPFGYSLNDEGNLVECPTELECLTTIRTLRGQGQSIRKIAAQVINPRTGKLFAATQIARML